MTSLVRSPEFAPRWAATARLFSNRSIAPVYVVVLAPLPFIALRAHMLLGRTHYQFLPLVPLGAAALAWRECRRLGQVTPGPRRKMALLSIASWLLLAVASFFVSPWFGSLAALAMLAAAIAAIGGGTLLRCALPAWTFLGLALGLPPTVDQELISRLQVMTSRIASLALDAIGVFHVMEGNVVRVSGRAFGVEEACSGVYSLFSVLFCTLFFVLWARRPPIRAMVTMVASVFWVLGTNVVRVVADVYLDTRWGIDVTEGWRHELLSLIVFGETLLLIASTDCLLDLWPAFVRVCRPRRARKPARDKATAKTVTENVPAPPSVPRTALDLGAPTRLPGLGGTWLGSPTAAVSFALLGLVQVAAIAGMPKWQGQPNARFTSPWSESDSANGLLTLQADSVPARSGSFRREDFKTETRAAANPLGEMSRYWRYQFGDSSAIASVDYPFQGWHDLTSCYRTQGWAVVDRERIPDGSTANGDGRPRIVAVTLAKGLARHGYLLFCLFDEQGNPIEPDAHDADGFFRQRLDFWRRLWRGSAQRRSTLGSVSLSSFQVQLFIESDYPLTAIEREETRLFFRELLSAILRRGPGSGATEP